MTDVAALAAFLLDHEGESMGRLLPEILREEGRRFSPLVTAALGEDGLLARLDSLLHSDDRAYYQTVYRELTALDSHDEPADTAD